MSLTRDEVKSLADLARLQLSDGEIAKAEKELDAILKFVDRLQKIDASGVEPQSMHARIYPFEFPIAKGEPTVGPGRVREGEGGKRINMQTQYRRCEERVRERRGNLTDILRHVVFRSKNQCKIASSSDSSQRRNSI
jgi:Asp-tRNA(Asn)/Glu-tRNA(Gln) amidotransferase C subunit